MSAMLTKQDKAKREERNGDETSSVSSMRKPPTLHVRRIDVKTAE